MEPRVRREGRKWVAGVDVDAPAARVWDLLTDTSVWPEWGPSVRDVDGPDRIELGSRGRVRTAVGVSLPFEITAFEEGRSWSWRVAGIGATDHRVRSTGDGCVVEMTAPWWATAYVPVLLVGVRRLAAMA